MPLTLGGDNAIGRGYGAPVSGTSSRPQLGSVRADFTCLVHASVPRPQGQCPALALG